MIEVDKWTKEHSVKFLEEVGIKKGDIIFDCCCGEGNYTSRKNLVIEDNIIEIQLYLAELLEKVLYPYKIVGGLIS